MVQFTTAAAVAAVGPTTRTATTVERRACTRIGRPGDRTRARVTDGLDRDRPRLGGLALGEPDLEDAVAGLGLGGLEVDLAGEDDLAVERAERRSRSGPAGSPACSSGLTPRRVRTLPVTDRSIVDGSTPGHVGRRRRTRRRVSTRSMAGLQLAGSRSIGGDWPGREPGRVPVLVEEPVQLALQGEQRRRQLAPPGAESGHRGGSLVRSVGFGMRVVSDATASGHDLISIRRVLARSALGRIRRRTPFFSSAVILPRSTSSLRMNER